jgi:hypothetical protein
MKNTLRLRGLALSFVLTLGTATEAKAQSQAAPKPSETHTHSKVNATVAPAPTPVPAKEKHLLGFKSTFDQYKPYTDEKAAAWKAANDEVGRIGGWRAYLKEANEPDPADPREAQSMKDKPAGDKPSPAPGSAPSPIQAPSQAPASGRPPHPHAGHGSK